MFDDPNVAHVGGRVDPIADIETIHTELALADLGTAERALKRHSRRVKSGDPEAAAALSVVEKLESALAAGLAARSVKLTEAEQLHARELHLLTAKPMMIVANVDDCRHGIRSGGTAGAGRSRRDRDGRDSRPGRGRDRRIARRRTRRVPRRARARRAGPAQGDSGRLPGSGIEHLLHRQREGGAGLDVPHRLPVLHRPPARFTPISRRASSAPRSSATTTTSPATAKPAPKRPASGASRARTTSSTKATSSTSDSTCRGLLPSLRSWPNAGRTI